MSGTPTYWSVLVLIRPSLMPRQHLESTSDRYMTMEVCGASLMRRGCGRTFLRSLKTRIERQAAPTPVGELSTRSMVTFLHTYRNLPIIRAHAKMSISLARVAADGENPRSRDVARSSQRPRHRNRSTVSCAPRRVRKDCARQRPHPHRQSQMRPAARWRQTTRMPCVCDEVTKSWLRRRDEGAAAARGRRTKERDGWRHAGELESRRRRPMI